MAVTASGAMLENAVESAFIKKGFQLVKYRDWAKNKDKFGEELILKDAPYDTIYGHKGKTEFLILSKKYDLEIRIECKWQQVPGSVDEKLPYLYLNAIEKIQERNFILLIDGDGWKKGAITWFKDAVKNKRYVAPEYNKFIDVMGLTEFMTWANNILR